jgi:hypothetical protein
LLAFLVLLGMIGLAIANRSLVRETVVIPLLYVIWLTYLAVSSIPQALVWAAFLVLAARLALHSLERKRKEPAARALPLRGDTPSRVQALTRWIRSAEEGDYYKVVLARHLAELAVDIAPRAGPAPDDGWQRLRVTDLDLPQPLAEYFRAGLSPAPARRRGLGALWRRWRNGEAPPSPLDLNPEKVVRFLEDQLEMPHDG